SLAAPTARQGSHTGGVGHPAGSARLQRSIQEICSMKPVTAERLRQLAYLVEQGDVEIFWHDGTIPLMAVMRPDQVRSAKNGPTAELLGLAPPRKRRSRAG